jgi:hypothetical protein
MQNNSNTASVSPTHLVIHVSPEALGSILVLALVFLTSCGGGATSAGNSAPPPVSITIVPAAVTMEAGQTEGQTFSANIPVTWSILEGQGTGGVIDTNGVYFPPQTTGTFHVVATSLADRAASAKATVTVTVGLEISPGEATMGFGEMLPLRPPSGARQT